MRIAYVAPYQGPDLIKRRPAVHNRSLAATVKIELFAQLLSQGSNDLEIISQGEVDKYQLKFYPAFCEGRRFRADIPIYYSSSFPVRFLTGFWEGIQTQKLFQKRHKHRPFDVVIIYNTKRAQLSCANYATRRLGIPVILDYEDDAFVNVTGHTENGLVAQYHRAANRGVLNKISGCFAVSPHLLSQLPCEIPKLLLRGVVDERIINTRRNVNSAKRNWVLFAGTHTKSKGVDQLIEAWKALELPGWELHIAGYGESTPALQKKAGSTRTIVFDGLVRGQRFADLLCSARICINPHDLSLTPGNVFAFKIIEYLAAGAHVITTPMGKLEREIEQGLTYMSDNDPATIATTLKRVISAREWERTAAQFVCEEYGPESVGRALQTLVQQVVAKSPDNQESIWSGDAMPRKKAEGVR